MKIGIYGYGNLGRGVELAVKACADMELFGVFTRRPPETVKTLGAPVYPAADAVKHAGEIDVMIICGGSATDLPEMTPALAEHFNVIDSFDTHRHTEAYAHVTRRRRRAAESASSQWAGTPACFSSERLFASAIVRRGRTHLWGRGRGPGPLRSHPPH
jgi:diaminopimelate dehydrogenase